MKIILLATALYAVIEYQKHINNRPSTSPSAILLSICQVDCSFAKLGSSLCNAGMAYCGGGPSTVPGADRVWGNAGPENKADNPMACRTNVSVVAVGPALETVLYRCKLSRCSLNRSASLAEAEISILMGAVLSNPVRDGADEASIGFAG
jgi:hypothetical protein